MSLKGISNFSLLEQNFSKASRSKNNQIIIKLFIHLRDKIFTTFKTKHMRLFHL